MKTLRSYTTLSEENRNLWATSSHDSLKRACKLEEQERLSGYRLLFMALGIIIWWRAQVECNKRTRGKPHCQPHFTPRGGPFQPRFEAPRKPIIDFEVKLPPLTKTQIEILATENVKFVKPAPLRPEPRKNMEKYCEFHKENGNVTDDCFSLRRQIESAIKTGKLFHLMKELQKTPQDGQKRKEIFMLHKLQPTVALKKPHNICSIKRNSYHLEPWMEQEMSFPPLRVETLQAIHLQYPLSLQGIMYIGSTLTQTVHRRLCMNIVSCSLMKPSKDPS
ncbi:hypothetical protein E3N88_40427 [Mikania micrantha]|uniref:Uncharacterized protein n=1 Tax=Mikania micrantha TaxID=192012 RepID=A0A5N6LMJ1_9ASTR|nr:hypothetical protein E3N88_40427 [Mikania micrantha]